MANSTASIFIKPTVAFNRGDTFVFGSWVCTADGAGSFQRQLTMTPNLKTGLVTPPEVVTGDLTGKFGEISLYNHVTPSFKGKTECIDHVCARIKLHTRLDIVNTKISAT
jgi:hypothetical protein